MANITESVKKIREAIYGKDVRESIAAGIEAINTESQNAKESAETAASNAQKAANDAEAAISTAATATVMASEAAGKANTAAETAAEKAQAADLAASGANAAAGAAQAAKEAANTAAELANSKAAAAETAAGQANTAAGAAQEAKTAAQTAAGAAQTQGNYAKAQGDRAAQLVDEIEDTDVGGMAADILALQSGKADLINGTVPENQLPELDFDPSGSAAAVQELLTSHTENQENPHSVTADQLGVTAKRTYTYVIGTSTAGWTENDCDYLCDGVDDQEEIQGALDNLPEWGGTVLLLSGTYYISKTIQFKNSFSSLCGNENSTTLKLVANSAYLVSTGALNNNCNVTNLILDGDTVGNAAILLGGAGTKHSIIGNTILNFNTGILAYGTYHYIAKNKISAKLKPIQAACSKSKICENWCDNPLNTGNGVGISLDSGTSENLISGNDCRNFFTGIDIYASKSTVFANRLSDCARGIFCNTADNMLILGNMVCDSNVGLGASYLTNSIISENHIIRGSGTPEDYAGGKFSILLSSTTNSNNLISGNSMLGKNYTTEGGANNTFVNNKYN